MPNMIIRFVARHSVSSEHVQHVHLRFLLLDRYNEVCECRTVRNHQSRNHQSLTLPAVHILDTMVSKLL